MACRENPPSSLPRNSCVPFPYNYPHPNPRPDTGHSGYVHPPQSQCLTSIDQVSVLHSRIAVLEEQLANANAQKDSAVISTRYILRLLSDGNTSTHLGGTSAEEVSELRRKLHVSKIKKNLLKAELQKALVSRDLPRTWPCQCCRTQASFTQSDDSTTVIEGLATGSTKQPVLHLLDSTGPIADPLIDLAGLESSSSVEATPELEHSDGYFSVSDGSEELLIETFPEDSSYLRHFLYGSGKENVSPSTNASSSIAQPARSLSGTPNAKGVKTRLAGGEPPTSSSLTSSQAELRGPGWSESKVGTAGRNGSIWNLNRNYNRRSATPDGPVWGTDKLFRSAEEREVAISMHKNGIGPTDYTFPDIFKYGMCYSPGPSVGDVYRTVSISGLASTTTVTALLEQVRGGVVVSAKLLDTTTITGFHTALITFLHEKAAISFEEYAVQRPLMLDGRRANVELLSKPTWPMPISLHKAIYEHGHSRCLTIRNFPRNISPEALRHDLRVCSVMTTDRIESMNMGMDDVLELRFESISTAGKGYGILTNFRDYQKCKVSFAPDPCAQPQEPLLETKSLSTEVSAVIGG